MADQGAKISPDGMRAVIEAYLQFADDDWRTGPARLAGYGERTYVVLDNVPDWDRPKNGG